MKQIIYNGRMMDAGTAIISAQNRGFRYGDGCFETMRAIDGRIALKELHFGRLLSSLDLLSFDVPDDLASTIEQSVMALCRQNDHMSAARIRLTVFRDAGAFDDVANNALQYVVESEHLTHDGFNETGLLVDVYKDARKQCDHFSHIKNNNFLPYIMAARWAKVHELDDALILNTSERIAESTIANVFIVKNGIIKTPVLSEGCIAGVMRKYLINACRKEGIPVEETTVTADDLQDASEVFLTNTIRGIRWVQQVGEHHYSCQVSKLLFSKLIKPLWK